MEIRFALPDIIIEAHGTCCAPELTREAFDEIRQRAEAIADAQIRTDLFRLIREVEKHR